LSIDSYRFSVVSFQFYERKSKKFVFIGAKYGYKERRSR